MNGLQHDEEELEALCAVFGFDAPEDKSRITAKHWTCSPSDD